MRLHRFYISETIGAQTRLEAASAELAHQLRKVFRLRIGDMVIVFDGSGSDHECAIAGFGDGEHPDRVILDVRAARPSRWMPSRPLRLYAALVKKDTFEFIAEKAAELGATEIIPVLAERSEKKAVNDERLRKIVIEASEQSGRGDVPAVAAVSLLEDAVAAAKRDGYACIAFHTEGESFSAKERAIVAPAQAPLALFIGPEGGWSETETVLFHKEKIPLLSLGSQVLRAETAAVAALSAIVFG